MYSSTKLTRSASKLTFTPKKEVALLGLSNFSAY